MAKVFNFIIVISEIITLLITLKKKDIKITRYTRLSNFVCLVSSLLLVIFGQTQAVIVLRFLSTVMLTITFIVAAFILLPKARTIKLFTGRAFIHHLLCPVLSALSYIYFEYHVWTVWALLPVFVTILYGLLMVLLNYKDKVDGPYPFFRIKAIGKKMTAVWMVILTVITSAVSFAVGYHPPLKTDIKYIFVHGLSGWGSYDPLYEYMPYWGMIRGDVVCHLNNKGYESYAASVDPAGSAWDRACELYAELYGTRVDYGKEHSERCHHDRYGEDFSGRALVKDFDGSRFVLIGHSFGGATVRLFSEILINGSEEERQATDESDLSGFFKGGNGDGLVAIVTLAAPTNGTTAYDLYEDPKFKTSDVSVPQKYEKNSDTVSKNVKKKNDGRIKEDYAAYDMHIDNALKLNDRITTFPDVYYFAQPYACTTTSEDGSVYPDSDMTENMFMKGSIIMAKYTGETAGGFTIDKSWQPNDGLVNTVSAMAPLGHESMDYKEGEELRPGIWYVFPTKAGDHMSPIGGLTKIKNVKPYYLELCEMLSEL